MAECETPDFRTKINYKFFLKKFGENLLEAILEVLRVFFTIRILNLIVLKYELHVKSIIKNDVKIIIWRLMVWSFVTLN